VRIGLIGGMANAMYCFARILRQQGYEAYYVEDEQDTFPMSQPLWEEVPLTLEPRRFGEDPLDAHEWRALAERSDWQPPGWVVPPDGTNAVPSRLLLARAVRWTRWRDRAEVIGYTRTLEPLSEQLRAYDRLVVCGVRVVAALMSGKPYVFWPHGGDAHIVPFQDGTAFERSLASLTRAAIARADVAGTHDPHIAARLEELGRPAPVPYLPFLVDTERYAPGAPTTQIATEVLARAEDRRIFFLASRQDFHWKGTDRFARAFAASVRGGAPFYLVVTPWGADVEATRGIFADAGVLDSVHYLESAVSKPILRDLYRVSDLVVDQFTVTAFGAVMLEAMACGTPVLINLDLGAFRSRWADFVPPPILRASSEEEIAAVLRAIADGDLDLEQLGRSARSWIQAHHGPEQARLYVEDAA
jgi:glycosyltransferase involved in cell wall biosynthesis